MRRQPRRRPSPIISERGLESLGEGIVVFMPAFVHIFVYHPDRAAIALVVLVKILHISTVRDIIIGLLNIVIHRHTCIWVPCS